MAEITASTEEDSSASRMGPNFLADQPVVFEDNNKVWPEWQFFYSKLQERLGALRNWRYSWWTHWAVLAAYFNPRRYIWLVTPNRMWRGAPINDQIIDSTGLQAVRTCASGLWSGLTPSTSRWFELETVSPADELDAPAKAWIADAEQKAYAVLDGSNFYSVMRQAYEDVTIIGTAPVIMYEDEENICRFYLPTAGEYYLGIGPRLSVDTFNREFNYTVSQVIARWGVENSPPQVTNLWRQGGGAVLSEFVVAHSVEPNFPMPTMTGEEVDLVSREFLWREVYWLRDQQTGRPFEATGFTESPVFVARWATTANDAYGRSPCMDALGDAKQVQLETLRKAEFIEKGVRPPMGADPALKNEPASIVPGNITYIGADGQKKGFWPLFEVLPQWLAGLTADIDTVNNRIKKCLFVDLFMAITQMEGVQPRNELELSQRNMERLQELGPFVHLFENEFAAPMLKRLFKMMLRRGILLPMPPSLQGRPLNLNFISIMRKAQRASEAVAFKDFLQMGGLLSAASMQAGLPNPLRTVNLDKAYRRLAEMQDVDQDLLFTLDEVEKHDKQRAQQSAAQQVPQMAVGAAEAAKTLSDTSLEGNSALTALLGRPGSGTGPLQGQPQQ